MSDGELMVPRQRGGSKIETGHIFRRQNEKTCGFDGAGWGGELAKRKIPTVSVRAAEIRETG